MDRLNSLMLRCSLIWLVAGFTFGAAMLMDRVLPGNWVAWMAPTHGHMLFVGWFLQFAVGVAYWLLPRRRTAARPLGYDERLAFLAVIALNLGLICRIAAEPAERAGHANNVTLTLLGASALLQFAAALVFVGQLWPRLAARPLRKTAPGQGVEIAQQDQTKRTNGQESGDRQA